MLLNVGEGDLATAPGARRAGSRPATAHQHAMVEALSAKIEMELGELEPDEAAVFMEELGIAESGLDRVIALSYRLLGLISFLTAGPDEVRAWPIPDGSTAVDAAGAIHTDLAKGFIRAETVAYDDLLDARLDGRGAQGRPAPLRGQDLPGPRRRRARDPLQPLSQLERAARSVRVELGVAGRSRPRIVAESARRIVVVIVVVVLVVGVVDLELGQEVVALLGRDVDRGRQAVVADVDEAVVALELDRRSPR